MNHITLLDSQFNLDTANSRSIGEMKSNPAAVVTDASRPQRLARIRRQVENGQYHVEATAVARAILGEITALS